MRSGVARRRSTRSPRRPSSRRPRPTARSRAPRSVGRRARSDASRGRSHRRRSPTTRRSTAAASSAWSGRSGDRELAISGRLPLEHGVVSSRRSATSPGAASRRQARRRRVEWQQSCADALVTLAQTARHAGPSAQPHDADRARRAPTSRPSSKAPGRSAPRPPNGSPATRAVSRSSGTATTSSTPASGAARPTHSSAHCTAATGTAATPAAPPRSHSTPTTSAPGSSGGETVLDNLILLCHRHHKRLHDLHIRTSGRARPPSSPTHDERVR